MPLPGIFFASLLHQSNRKIMFRKTNPNPQLYIYTAPSMQLGSRASKKYSDPNSWHNQFYSLVTTKIDEEIFKPLLPEGKKSGRPNASIRILVAMSVLKEGFGCSDEDLFEKCEFDLLTRMALGMELLTDEPRQYKRNNVEAAMFQYSFHTRNGKTRYRGLLKHRMHAYSRCMWMNLRRMVIFQISTFQRSIFALFGPIREAFGSFKGFLERYSPAEPIAMFHSG